MRYRVVIENKNHTFPIKGLNELLNGRLYNFRTKKYQNPIKTDNDKECLIAIKKYLKGVHIDKPIKCVFYSYMANKMHDRGNINSAVEKSFLDALQIAKVISNDGWDDVMDSEFHTQLDRSNPRIEVEIKIIG